MKIQLVTALLFLIFFVSCQSDELEIGIEQVFELNQGQYKQFTLPLSKIPAESDYVFFMLSQLSGDSNIYVSPVAPPTKDNCIQCWKQIGPGGHSVAIPRAEWPTAPNSKFYIAVEAVDNTISKLNSWVTGSSSSKFFL